MSTHHYEIRVVGSIGPAAQEAFSDMGMDVEPVSTVLSSTLNQRGLHAILNKIQTLGLELVDVRQLPTTGDLLA